MKNMMRPTTTGASRNTRCENFWNLPARSASLNQEAGISVNARSKPSATESRNMIFTIDRFLGDSRTSGQDASELSPSSVIEATEVTRTENFPLGIVSSHRKNNDAIHYIVGRRLRTRPANRRDPQERRMHGNVLRLPASRSHRSAPLGE